MKVIEKGFQLSTGTSVSAIHLVLAASFVLRTKECRTDHSPDSSSCVKNAKNFTFTPYVHLKSIRTRLIFFNFYGTERTEM
jgi:hypothetical protein